MTKPSTKLQKSSVKKKTDFRPQVRSRHPSHDCLRTTLEKLPFKSVVRLGSTTPLADDVTHGGARIELNTVKAVKNSANKLSMKSCFAEAGVKTADWFEYNEQEQLFYKTGLTTTEQRISAEQLPYPIVTKHIFGSRGTGNTLIKSSEELVTWMQGKTLSNYIFEKYYDYNKEYRLHVMRGNCFYTCRKMLKSDTPAEERWYRNDSNSVWILESNPLFDKPSNFDAIISECIKALNAVGLDVGACDVRVQSTKDKKGNIRINPEFIIVEINSAPSFGEITAEKYKEMIPIILKAKHYAHIS